MPLQQPQRALSVMLVLVALSTAFLDLNEYRRAALLAPDAWRSVLAGHEAAPQQFRIAVPWTADFLTRHTPLRAPHAFALIDLLALLLAMFVLRALLLRSPAWLAATLAERYVAAAVFVALLQYALLWLTWYQRPETLPVAALLALSVWFSTQPVPLAGAAGRLATIVSLVALGLLQGVTRSDAGVCFHLGVAAACLLPMRGAEEDSALPRRWQLAASLLAALAAGAVQVYLARVAYPAANYGINPEHRHPHPIFMLGYNLTRPLWWPPFLLFLAPWAWLAVQWVQRRLRPSRMQAGVLLGASLFLAATLLYGKVDEVRILLPFALALAPLMASAAIRRISSHAVTAKPVS